MQSRTGVFCPVAILVGGKRYTGADIRANDQRIYHTGCGAGVSETLIPARNHLCEREGRTAKHARQGSDFLDVVRCISTHTLRIGAVRRIDLVAANVFPVWRSDSEMPGNCLQSMTGQLTHGEIVASYRIQRVDQFATWCDETYPSMILRVG